MLGVAEAIDEKDLRALMETNFWAALHLTREVVKVFERTIPALEVLAGSLFRLAAWVGEVAFPGDSIYHAS